MERMRPYRVFVSGGGKLRSFRIADGKILAEVAPRAGRSVPNAQQAPRSSPAGPGRLPERGPAAILGVGALSCGAKERAMVTKRVLQLAAQRLAERFRAHRVILFGSHARGTADARSDVDLLVICDFEGKRRALMVDMDRSLAGLGFARDVVVLRPEEYEQDRHIPGTIARPASLEGQVLYERA